MKKWNERIRRGLALILALGMMLACGAALGEENKIWQQGDRGEKITWIQTRLRELGYLEKEPDGLFDAETADALARFQEDQGLLATGMGDEITLKILKTARETAASRNSVMEDGLTEEAWDGFYAAYSSMAPGAMAWEADEIGWNTEEFTTFDPNRFLSVVSSPLSTFAADVDTSSYAQFRRRVLSGMLVPPESVRVEEMLNYFRYNYAAPEGEDPFGVTVEIGNCPWNAKTKLMLIGLQAAEVQAENRPAHNLVFLIDTSGSMEGKDRLDLVRRAFLLLLEELRAEDTVSIVAYASQDRVVLEGVPASEKTRIMEAISDLEAGGATNGTAGLIRAYEIAEKYRKEGGVNRILLATDGDLNVGPSSEGELARLVTAKKESGISLTCLGFGMGNYKDNKMEALADYGNGNCRYIDTIHEARKALVEEAGGTFITVAKDVKVQVDFNPAFIRGYRLIGYEDRLMAAEDFADDAKDGGEIGSGHRVTALYELVTVDSDFDFGETGSRYRQTAQESGGNGAGEKTESLPAEGEWLTVAIRAKKPEGKESQLWEIPVDGTRYSETLTENLRFAAAVAECAMLLRDSEWKGSATWDSALALARSCESVTGDLYKEEFIYLLGLLSKMEEK